MFMFALIVLLFLTSIAVPVLLIPALILTYYSVRNIMRKRRAILDLVESVQAEQATDRAVRYFR